MNTENAQTLRIANLFLHCSDIYNWRWIAVMVEVNSDANLRPEGARLGAIVGVVVVVVTDDEDDEHPAYCPQKIADCREMTNKITDIPNTIPYIVRDGFLRILR